MTAVALLSGGLDSTVACAAAHRAQGVQLALTVDYRQRAAAREARAAADVAKALGIRHRRIALDFLGEVTTTALVNRAVGLPELAPKDLDDVAGAARESMRRVWVPNRNGLLIAVAAAFAESMGARDVVVGFNREEAATFADNSAEFLERASAALALSTASGVRVISPTIELDKVGILRLAGEVGAPLCYIWSCYEGGKSHCWRCESCLRLRRALDGAGVRERFESEWREANGA